jgi:hypothetical protein
MASQWHRICVADLFACRHLSQVGSSVNPSLKRCPLRWQCPVSNPTTHLSWSLFSFNRSFVLLAEGPDINPFACLIPVVDSQYFYDLYLSSPWSLSWQLQLRCRKLVQVLNWVHANPSNSDIASLICINFHIRHIEFISEPTLCASYCDT